MAWRVALSVAIAVVVAAAFALNTIVGFVALVNGAFGIWGLLMGPRLKARREAMGDLDDEARRNASKFVWTQGGGPGGFGG